MPCFSKGEAYGSLAVFEKGPPGPSLTELNMSFDLSKYCHISSVMTEKGMKTAVLGDGGLSLFYVEQGSCVAKKEGSEFALGREDIICFGGTAEFEIGEGCVLSGLGLTGIIADRYGKEMGPGFVTNIIFVPFLPQQIKQVIENFDTMSDMYMTNLAFEMINTLSRSPRKAVIVNQVVIEAIKLINDNYANGFGIEQVANTLDVSKSHLVREFQKSTGITPGKYLIKVRIDAVKELLSSSSYSLNTIAMKTGFSGDNYLCKAFKKVTGETPMAYRDRVIASQYLPNQLTLLPDSEDYRKY